MPTAGLLAVIAAGGRRAAGPNTERDLPFVETVVGELRAGASLRASLLVACGDDPACRRVRRRLEVGLPLPTCVDGLREALPSVGELVESAVAAGADGGRMLPVFEEMVVHAATESHTIAELRAATAQVRASMTVLIGLPTLYLVWSASTGRLAGLLALPGGAMVATIGATLFVLGVVVMVVLGRLGR
ncbi:hypothetical protein BH23ACT5_BH23ACT5_05470 [soil metagenome]